MPNSHQKLIMIEKNPSNLSLNCANVAVISLQNSYFSAIYVGILANARLTSGIKIYIGISMTETIQDIRSNTVKTKGSRRRTIRNSNSSNTMMEGRDNFKITHRTRSLRHMVTNRKDETFMVNMNTGHMATDSKTMVVVSKIKNGYRTRILIISSRSTKMRNQK